jgi:hypothetical protein
MFYKLCIAPKWMKVIKSISKQIAVQISTVLGKKVEESISLGWESDLKEGTTIEVLGNRKEVCSNREN